MPDSNTRTVVAIDYAPTPARHPHSDSHRTPNSHPSPILTHRTPSAHPDVAQPEFAELLTPLKFRRRKLQPRPDQQPTSLPLVAGPSDLGYYTLEGDLYRGSAYNPTQPPPAVAAQVDDDAISLGTKSTTSSTSNWSWGSGNFDRAMAVIERVGEALGVRRGSAGSSSSDSSADGSDMESLKSQATAPKKGKKRRGSFMSSVSRQTSRGGAEGVKAKYKRDQLPKRRQFTLLVPPPALPAGDVDIGISTAIETHVFTEIGKLSGDRVDDKKYPSDRVITTPSLPTVLAKIQSVRLLSGYSDIYSSVGNTPTQTSNASSCPTASFASRVPVRRGGSAPGRSRKATGFVNPLPLLSQSQSRLQCRSPSAASSRTATQSRLDTLRGAAETHPPIRPKSVPTY